MRPSEQGTVGATGKGAIPVSCGSVRQNPPRRRPPVDLAAGVAGSGGPAGDTHTDVGLAVHVALLMPRVRCVRPSLRNLSAHRAHADTRHACVAGAGARRAGRGARRGARSSVGPMERSVSAPRVTLMDAISMEDKQWTVRIRLTEDGDDTRAEAVLAAGDASAVTGRGSVHRSALDLPVPLDLSRPRPQPQDQDPAQAPALSRPPVPPPPPPPRDPREPRGGAPSLPPHPPIPPLRPSRVAVAEGDLRAARGAEVLQVAAGADA